MQTLNKLLHIMAALYNLAFVYTPLHNWEYGFMVVQFVTMPLLIVTGVGFVHLRKQKITSAQA